MEKKVDKRRRLKATGYLGGIKGGRARAKSLSKERRKEIAVAANKARWADKRKNEAFLSQLRKRPMPEKSMNLFLIAEIGINHNGDLNIAKQLIAAAHYAGFDAVKFQKRTIEKVYTKALLDSPRESPWGKTQRDQKMGLELSHAQYLEIDHYCKSLGIQWSASAWDVDSQHFIRDFGVPFNKVASPMLGHKPLLREIASEQKRTFISTGMSTIDEIDEVVNLFVQANCPFELMHCCSAYPMQNSDANLLCIPFLRERYNCRIGWSGHETDLVKICISAVALGATSIERHITLNRALYGSDQAASVETHALRDLADSLREVPVILGAGEKKILESEWPIRKKLRVEVS